MLQYRNVPYTLGEIEHFRCPTLGEYENFLTEPSDRPEAVFDAVWSTAKEIWPTETAKAEDFVKQQAIRYATAEAKAQAASLAQSPVLWIVLGVAAGWLYNSSKRRRR